MARIVSVNAIAFCTGSFPLVRCDAVRSLAASDGFGAGAAGRAPGRAVARCVTLLVWRVVELRDVVVLWWCVVVVDEWCVVVDDFDVVPDEELEPIGLRKS